MGSVFKHIADTALQPTELGPDEPCQHCQRDDVVVYDYIGRIIDPTRAADVALATDDNEIFAACADCILGGNLQKNASEIDDVRRVVNRFAADPKAALAAFSETPHIPLMMQDSDWPICCGELCEFRGNPANYDESVLVPARNQFWDRQPTDWQSDFDLRPEALREVCLFKCQSCEKTYFIWQST